MLEVEKSLVTLTDLLLKPFVLTQPEEEENKKESGGGLGLPEDITPGLEVLADVHTVHGQWHWTAGGAVAVARAEAKVLLYPF